MPTQPDLEQAMTLQELEAQRVVTNNEILANLREDSFSGELLKMCIDDCKLGRMRYYTPQGEAVVPSDATITPRFCIEQGVRRDGTPKLRPVDDFTRSRCNIATIASERLRYDSLDHFTEVVLEARARYCSELSLWKADVDAAYPRVPIKPRHRRYAWVVVKHRGKTYAFQHLALPFGALSSVHGWDRAGACVQSLAVQPVRITFLLGQAHS